MPVGKTRDAGWQIGVAITVPHLVDDVWRVLVGPTGLTVWLGDGVELVGEPGQNYSTTDGGRGQVRSFRPGDRVRVTWQPRGADRETTVQIAVQDKGDRTGVRFHQERLADAGERERQRAHWKHVAEQLRVVLAAELG